MTRLLVAMDESPASLRAARVAAMAQSAGIREPHVLTETSDPVGRLRELPAGAGAERRAAVLTIDAP